MAVENFDAYSETDPNSRITKISSRVTWASIAKNEDAYVWKDKGANYFSGNFTHLLTIRSTGLGGAVGLTARCSYWALTNLVDEYVGIRDASGDGLFLFARGNTGTGDHKIRLGEMDGGTEYSSAADYIITINTNYYLKIVRDESEGDYGKLYCYTYSDSARTTLVNTQSITLHSSKKDYRFIFALQSINSSDDRTHSGYTENLEVLYNVTSTVAPSVTTQAVTDIAIATATGNGNVTNLGVPAATQHGHCWANFHFPTTANDKTTNGVPSATGAFTSSLTGLTQNTFYWCRAYITNSVGTFYGNEVGFITPVAVPVVTTDLATGVAVTTALGNGSIDNNGGSAITQHGVCWDTSANPNTGDDKTEEGATSIIGDFSSLMTGLTAETTYHYRAYAVNASGTGYGADVTFKTHAVGAPIVTTQRTTSVTAESATGKGTIVDIGGSAVTEHGHCWGTSYNPETPADSETTLGAGEVGAFTSKITGLTAGTPYYIRAYATNSYGTSYGDNDVINQVAGELKGVIAILSEWLVYTSKSGTQRALLGDEF